MIKLSDKAKKVFEYVKAHQDENITAADVVEGLDGEYGKRSVDAVFTGLCKKGLTERVVAEVAEEDGTHEKVKFFRVTDDGMGFDPYAEAEAEAESEN